MIELTVAWKKSIQLAGEHDPLRSEYGNLVGFCDDPRLGHPIVVVKNFTPWAGSDLPLNDSFVFRAIPNLENDVLSGQETVHQRDGDPRKVHRFESEPLPTLGGCQAGRQRKHPDRGPCIRWAGMG